jgi:hypothetical protein
MAVEKIQGFENMAVSANSSSLGMEKKKGC